METTKALTTAEKGSWEYRLSICRDCCERQELIFNPAALQKTFAKVQTMQQCIELTRTGDLPTLLAMAHQDGNSDKVVALVALNIVALDSYLHLNHRLTDVEVDTLARNIVQTYGGALSFADLNIILTNVRHGVYGKLYERLSGAEFMNWIESYYDARLNECAAYSVGARERSMERERPPKMTSKEKEMAALAQITAEVLQNKLKIETNNENQ